MNVSAFCIKHKVTTILAVILIAIFGFTFYSNLKLTLIPNIEYPAAFVQCVYSGAGPEEIEELITRPLESAIATVSGVDSIQSISNENYAIIVIMYDDGTDLDQAALKLRERFDQLSLPDGAMDPVVYNLNFNEMMPTITVAMMGNDLSDMQTMADKTISPALERIEGVAAVDIYGGVDAQITVAVDSTRLAGYNLSITYISQYLQGANVLIPGGDIRNGSQSLTVSTDGQMKSVQDVANTLIPLPTGGYVRLNEVADVYMDQNQQDSIAKSNGMDCIVLSVSKQSNANEVETANAVKNVLAGLEEENPQFEYLVVYDSSDYIMRTANRAIQNIIMGVILAAIVVFIFLRRPGATFAIAVSMPFCILTVFVAMYLFDVTLNMISLGGIAMGVGMIVDNSIVVLENIYRYAADGHSRYDACVKGTKEVTLSVLASTLTTVAVFLPIGLSGGLAGMLFRDFSLTVAFLLLASLIIAITLVPLMCYFLLDETKVRKRRMQHDEKAPPLGNIFASMRRGYLKILNFFIRKRFVAVLISVGLVVLFLASMMTTTTVLMPEMDQGQISIDISMPVGAELDETVNISDRVVDIVQDNCPELESLYYSASSGSSSVVVNLVSVSDRDRSSKEVASAFRVLLQDIAGCEITVDASGMMAMTTSGGDIYVEISGEESDVLAEISSDLAREIATLPGAVNVASSVADATPAVKVNINRDSAAMYGLTVAGVGSAVRAELNGVTATTVTMNGADIDVVIKGNEVSAASLDALRSMPIAAGTGGYIPLSSIAEVTVELTPQTIYRYNQTRQVSVSGDIDETTDIVTITALINEVIADYDVPEGYYVETSGTYEDMNENFGDLYLALAVALGLIYFVLASQFDSFIMPIIVMLILPIALTGALFGLPLTGSDMSIVSIIGLIMLSGVVVNSSIILVDYIKIRRLMGESKNDAIMEACPLRIRPIMMTTLTTVLAMVPMSLGMGDGAEMMQPMAIVMISGMIISTITTLFFTPVYYSLLDSLTVRITNLFKRKRPPAVVEESTPVG